MKEPIYFENLDEIKARYELLYGDNTQKSYIFLYNQNEVLKIYNYFNGHRPLKNIFQNPEKHFELLSSIDCFTVISPISFIIQKQNKNILGINLKKVNGSTLNNLNTSIQISNLFENYQSTRKEIKYLNDKQIILHDITYSNIMFDGNFRLIDVDEYQSPFHNKGNFNDLTFEENITHFNLCLYYYLIGTSTKDGINKITKTIGLKNNQIPPRIVDDIMTYIEVLLKTLSEYYGYQINTIADCKTASKRILSK